MMRKRFVLALIVLAAGWSRAAGFSTPPGGDILATGSGRVALFAPDGTVKWEYPAGNIHEAWMLPNGNVLFADGNLKEVTPDKKVVWSYKPQNQKGGGTYTCQRLPNGNTVVGENSSSRVLEIDPEGNIAVEIQTPSKSKDPHHHMRMARKLANGNYLVCHSGDHIVKEYRPDGTIAWEQKTPNIAFLALRLPDGNTLISSLGQIQKYTPGHQVIWEFKTSDLPELAPRNLTGMHVLPNGNLLIGCYSGYANGKGAGMFEITPEKKLVWAYVSPNLRDKSMMGAQMLGPDKTNPLR